MIVTCIWLVLSTKQQPGRSCWRLLLYCRFIIQCEGWDSIGRNIKFVSFLFFSCICLLLFFFVILLDILGPLSSMLFGSACYSLALVVINAEQMEANEITFS